MVDFEIQEKISISRYLHCSKKKHTENSKEFIQFL